MLPLEHNESFVRVDWFRLYDRGGAAWLLCLMRWCAAGATGHQVAGEYVSGYPQCLAIVDDFGNLVPVGPLQ